MEVTTKSHPHLFAHLTKATPARLKDKTWGARVEGQILGGRLIRVIAKNGKEWTAEVIRVVWQGPDAALVTYRSTERRERTIQAANGSDRGHAPSPVRGYSNYCTGTAACRCYDCAS